jgi:hypothetical protein
LVIAFLLVEQHNTIPPNMRFVRCIMFGTHCTARRSSCAVNSEGGATTSSVVWCPAGKLASALRFQLGCWTQCAVRACSSKPNLTSVGKLSLR